ncbi:MAG TPA: efflux RND transporter periplasmic adaptor subunit [Gemmatimonadales bacterium]|nr:efflux RND transporter periplasmic adaptor subunit [Gemmatimonadales bacterium]
MHDLSRLRIDRTTPAPVRRALIRSLVLLVMAIAIVVVTFTLLRDGAPLVQTVVAEVVGSRSGGGASVTANGYVVARTRASVSAKIPGRLAYLGVSEGSFVRQGQVIARLENADYVAALAQADAQVAAARAELIEAEASRDQLRREAGRLSEVRAQNPQLVPQQDVEAAESRLAQAEARVRAAAARVEAAVAGQRLSQANLENTLIRAPFTGTVLRKEAEIGEVVAPSVGGGLTRGAVVTMANLSTLEVEVDVNEAYIARIRSGQPARITLDAYPDTSFRGRVRQVVPTADRQRATVQVKVAILERDPRILPEMGARVDFLEPETRPAAGTAEAAAAPRIRVPVGAVRTVGGRTVVWLVRDGRLTAREVEAGPSSGGYREVRRGLSGGEVLLVSGLETPSEGARVRTVSSP